MIQVLVGNNALLIKQATKEIRQAFIAEHGDMALEQVDGEDLTPGKLEETLQALPFLTAKRMVVLRNVSAQKDVAERLQDIWENIPETTDVLVIESAPDKRTAFYKFLLKQDNVQKCDELDEQGLAQWLVNAAKDMDAELPLSDARFLVQRVGNNQQLLQHELEKLALYDRTVSRQNIELLTERSPQSSTFDLLDAAMNGQQEKASQLYAEQRAQREEPQKILGLIAWQLHILALVKAGEGRDPATIAKEAKLNPYVVRKTQGLARRLSMGQIKDWVRRTRQLDVSLKSEPINADDALQELLLTFSLQGK